MANLWQKNRGWYDLVKLLATGAWQDRFPLSVLFLLIVSAVMIVINYGGNSQTSYWHVGMLGDSRASDDYIVMLGTNPNVLVSTNYLVLTNHVYMSIGGSIILPLTAEQWGAVSKHATNFLKTNTFRFVD
jgi:hypothetical protein